jgi:hypothetical protein
MLIDMQCSCGAGFQMQIESEDSSGVMLFANRFTQAHTACGFMSPVVTNDVKEQHKRYDYQQNREKEL